MKRFRGGLVFKAQCTCVSLNSRLESNKKEEGGSPYHATLACHADSRLLKVNSPIKLSTGKKKMEKKIGRIKIPKTNIVTVQKYRRTHTICVTGQRCVTAFWVEECGVRTGVTRP